MYHLERKVGVLLAEESDAKRAFLAKYSKAMKCNGMVQQNKPKKNISTRTVSQNCVVERLGRREALYSQM